MKITVPPISAPATTERAAPIASVLARPASAPAVGAAVLAASPRLVAQRQQVAAIAGSPRQVAQRQALAGAAPVQRERYSTAVGGELLQMDDKASNTPMAFLEPNRPEGTVGGATNLAPVHLSKNVKPSALAAIKGATASPLDLATFNIHNASNPKPHLTLTNGLMAAALADSPLTAHLAAKGRRTNLNKLDKLATTTTLGQNKKVAGDTVSAFAEDLGLKQFSVPDNLLFEHNPGDKEGQLTFEQVASFHDAIHTRLREAIEPAAQSGSDSLPFASGGSQAGVSFPAMSEQVTRGAQSLIERWPAWSNTPPPPIKGKGKGKKAISLDDFRLGEKGGDDLIKGVMSINRIHGAALSKEGNLFDEAFFREHLLNLPEAPPTGKKEKLTPTQSYILNQLRKHQPAQTEESKRGESKEEKGKPGESKEETVTLTGRGPSVLPATTLRTKPTKLPDSEVAVRDTGAGLGLGTVAAKDKEEEEIELPTHEQDELVDEQSLSKVRQPAKPTAETWPAWGWRLAHNAYDWTGGRAGRLLSSAWQQLPTFRQK